MNKIANKTILLSVLEFLYQNSSKDKTFCNMELAEELNKKNILCDRKTVSRNLALLKQFGFPIISKGRNHYFDRKKDTFFVENPILPFRNYSEKEKEKILSCKKLYLLIHFCFVYMQSNSATKHNSLKDQISCFMKGEDYVLSERTVNRNQKYMITYGLPIDMKRKRKNSPENTLIYRHECDLHFPYHDENGKLLIPKTE